ncbi:g3936 [Coccomyxa viridis]|uniref:G3936 protein n=1 Tax=Coccomyxa viridis TaxID=1274662 RepID=A0ABP1FRC9_9CHLO
MLALLERTAGSVLSPAQPRCFAAAAASTSGRLPLASCRLADIHTASFSPADRTLRTQAHASKGMQAPQQQQSRSMFIQTSVTPNPASLMFLPGEKVMQSGSKSFDSARDGMSSPLAKRLFAIDGVSGVFFGSDFVTVTKSDEYVWSVLKPEIFAAIMEHFTSGDPLFTDPAAQTSNTAISEDDSEVVAMIKELLETRIRPAVMEDGGDIVFQGFDEETGQVVLKMQGACAGCPSSSLTLKSGIENMLMHYIPEVKEVIEAPADEAELAGLAEFAKLEQHLSA